MEYVAKKDTVQPPINKTWLISTAALGLFFLSVPIVLIFVDPLMIFASHKLRIQNGSMVHEVLRSTLDGPRFQMFLFNVTNAPDFLSGADDKLKLEEVGPFVYQEYRKLKDLEINAEAGVMRYTPQLWIEFIPEGSIGRPEDFYVTIPNISFLSSSAFIAKSPYFIRQLFNMVVSGLQAKPFVNVTVADALWGYPDKIMTIANTVVPGIVRYNSTGILKWLYDVDGDYVMELGTKGADKFKVKKVTRLEKNRNMSSADVNMEVVQTFEDTYEGAAIPMDVHPDMPINIYRHSFCKSFKVNYIGTKKMEYGADAFVYTVANTTFNDRQLCDSRGWCPGGLMDLSSCYNGIPFAMSKGHFVDGDPRLLDRLEGLKPDRTQHNIVSIIDPKIGVLLSGYLSLQVNLFLGDVGYNPRLWRLKDLVLPVTHAKIYSPKSLPQTRDAIHLMYTSGPYMVLGSKIICVVLGLMLLICSLRMVYSRWASEKKGMVIDQEQDPIRNNCIKSQIPLLEYIRNNTK